MFIQNFLFYSFSILLVFCAFMVVFSKHTVFSLLFLVSCFIFSSFLLFLLECELLALLFLVVYVGAIAILFLFAVMMLESKLIDLSRNVMKYVPLGLFFVFFLLLLILYQFFLLYGKNPYKETLLITYQNWYDLIDSVVDIDVYGQILFSYFLLQVLVAGLILLLILIGVVYLTNTYNIDHQIKEQASFKQLARKAKFYYIN